MQCLPVFLVFYLPSSLNTRVQRNRIKKYLRLEFIYVTAGNRTIFRDKTWQHRAAMPPPRAIFYLITQTTAAFPVRFFSTLLLLLLSLRLLHAYIYTPTTITQQCVIENNRSKRGCSHELSAHAVLQ